MKKGQITLFIIVAILILFMVGFIFALSGKLSPNSTEDISSQVNSYVRSCISKTSSEALKTLSMQGGYYELPSGAFVYREGKIPVYYDQRINLSPPLETLEEEFSKFLDNELPECLKFNEISRQGFKVIVGEPRTFTTISRNQLSLEIDVPIEISKKDFKLHLDNFRAQIETDYGEAHDSSVRIVNKILEDPKYLDYTFLGTISHPVTIIPITDNAQAYLLSDKQFNYIFVVRYK